MNNYFLLALTIALPALGVGIGQGLAAIGVLQALNKQPGARADIGRAFYIGLAFMETGAIVSLIVSLMLIFKSSAQEILSYARLGITLALAVPTFFVGIGASFGLRQAVISIARQPFAGRHITTIMLITQSVLQTPVIFGLIIAWIIYSRMEAVATQAEALVLCASGSALAIGALGPIIGLSYFAYHTCAAIGYNRSIYQRLVSFALLSQAIIETPLLFALTVALILALFAPASSMMILVAFAAALASGLSTLAPGISSGRVAAAASYTLARSPASAAELVRTSMLSQIFIDTATMYGVIVALALLFI